ncbi:hypothetical protein EYZ11_010685 [Aspergillus tanneri]|uniref:Uncharacterized protein n=1 Tax=Aspergillus tanneri TaxID=1220188 RepID=A0A4S3J4P5_9EURO|nr:hypothetical protein EYZ11_010685 [Aspergillus tanneri]
MSMPSSTILYNIEYDCSDQREHELAVAPKQQGKHKVVIPRFCKKDTALSSPSTSIRCTLLDMVDCVVARRHPAELLVLLDNEELSKAYVDIGLRGRVDMLGFGRGGKSFGGRGVLPTALLRSYYGHLDDMETFRGQQCHLRPLQRDIATG